MAELVHNLTEKGVFDFINLPSDRTDALIMLLIYKLRAVQGDCFFNNESGINWTFIQAEDRLKTEVTTIVTNAISSMNMSATFQINDLKFDERERTGKLVITINNKNYSINLGAGGQNE